FVARRFARPLLLGPLRQATKDCLLIDVVSLDRIDGGRRVEVSDPAHFACVALYREQPILHDTSDGRELYAIADGDVTYVHRPAPRITSATGAPARAPVAAVRARLRLRERSGRRTAAIGVGLLVPVVGGVALATTFTASNTVPVSRVGKSVIARTLAQLTPPACSALALTNLIVTTGSGVVGT